jgi:hypothetical protein
VVSIMKCRKEVAGRVRRAPLLLGPIKLHGTFLLFLRVYALQSARDHSGTDGLVNSSYSQADGEPWHAGAPRADQD